MELTIENLPALLKDEKAFDNILLDIRKTLGCTTCNKNNVKYLACSKCKTIYCDKICQKANWIVHKELCNTPDVISEYKVLAIILAKLFKNIIKSDVQNLLAKNKEEKKAVKDYVYIYELSDNDDVMQILSECMDVDKIKAKMVVVDAKQVKHMKKLIDKLQSNNLYFEVRSKHSLDYVVIEI